MLARMSPVLPLEVDGKLMDDAPATVIGMDWKPPENPIYLSKGQYGTFGCCDVVFSRDSWGIVTYNLLKYPGDIGCILGFPIGVGSYGTSLLGISQS